MVLSSISVYKLWWVTRLILLGIELPRNMKFFSVVVPISCALSPNWMANV